MKNKILLTILIFLSLDIFIHANEFEFSKGIKAYNDGNFKDALYIFEKLNEKYDSPALYYNIGNCHIKIGNIGFAVSSYYSALLRDPTNPDIKHNLSYVQNLTKDKIVEEYEIKGFRDAISNIIRHFSLKFHQLLFIIIYISLIIIFFISHFLTKKFFNYPFTQSILVSLLLIQSIFLHQRIKDYKIKYGVVIAKELAVRYGPSKAETEAFVIHEGTKFNVYNIENESAQIKLKDGKIGWVDLDKITIVK